MKIKEFHAKAALRENSPVREPSGRKADARGVHGADARGVHGVAAQGVPAGAGAFWRSLRCSASWRKGLILPLALIAVVAVAVRFVPGPASGHHVTMAVSLASLPDVNAGSEAFGLDTVYPPLPGGRAFSPAAPMASGDIRLDAHPSDALAGRAAFRAYAVAPDRGGLLRFSHGAINIVTRDGPVALFRLGRGSVSGGQDMFEADYFSGGAGNKGGTPPLLYGEAQDAGGLPLRWSPGILLPGGGAPVCDQKPSTMHNLLRAMIRGLSVPGQGDRSGNAGKYKSHALRYAEKYGLAASLVLAIMHTESNFNPFAVSRSRAVGLMQIVPDTAGHETHRYLTGSPEQPSLELLFSPEDNIRYGAAYLHLLARRYFGGVHDGRSRQMCVIAAYNGGPGAVLRLFDPLDQDSAVARINSMSPEQVYAALTNEMPNAETRRYVELVLDRMRHYGL